MTRTLEVALALLCVVGFLAMARRASESRNTGQSPDAKSRGGSQLDSLQDRIVSRVLARRRWWISPTTTVGTRAIRVMVISYLTRWEHLQELIGELREAAATL